MYGKKHDQTFETLRRCLTDPTTLAYYDPEAVTYVMADASPVGLGAVLIQTQNGLNRIIEYASKSLTAVEKRYSQTEKEALGLVWACERFHTYLYGKEFTLITDHKPLEFIFSSRSKPSLRIERWVLRLQGYMYKVKYCKGKNNIADVLSRLSDVEDKTFDEVTEAYVRQIVEGSVPIAMTLDDIKEKSETDQEISKLRNAINNQDWNQDELKHFRLIKDELCVISPIVLRGTRLIIPTSLRKRILHLAHEGHPGIVAMKQRLRAKVWWPGIDGDAEKTVKSCRGCQLVSSPPCPEPLNRTRLPDQPWQDLAADFIGPLPSGDYILVVIDYYSRFFELECMKVINTSQTIDKILRMFCRFGIPRSLTTDNGPQFRSGEFRQFCLDHNIYHRHTTPLWPQANGEVERQNRTLLKRIKIAHAMGKDWKREILDFY